MDYRWKVTNTGRRSPGTRVPMVAQILQRNVHVVMSMLPSAAARRFWRRTAILLRSVRLAVNSGEKNLYRVPEIVTRGRFPDGGESDSTWRTQEARHVGSDTIAPGF